MDAKVSDEEAGSSSSMLLRLKARFTRRTRFALMFGLPAVAIIALGKQRAILRREARESGGGGRSNAWRFPLLCRPP